MGIKKAIKQSAKELVTPPDYKALAETNKKFKDKEEKIKGLSGWLILPIIGLFLSIFILLYDLLSVNAQYEFNAYNGILSLIDVGLLIFVIMALIMIFNKKKTVPKIMIAFYITNIILQIVLAFLVEDYSGVIQPLIGGAIWIPYFLKSERVRNTFVN